MDKPAFPIQKQVVKAFTLGVLAGLLAVGHVGGSLGAEPSPSTPATKKRRNAPRPSPGDACKPPAPAKKIKVSLKPDTEVADLIVWYSTLTCRSLVVSSGVPLSGKKVTLLTPTPVTLAELHRLFLGALETVGLTLERDGKFLYVIEAARARHSNTPVGAGP